jgi:PIN domain nuclease of toxin-antitoxin system
MNYLLDTHAYIWWNENSPKLPAQARQKLSDCSNQIWLRHDSVFHGLEG